MISTFIKFSIQDFKNIVKRTKKKHKRLIPVKSLMTKTASLYPVGVLF